jgi:hypothetical protein
MARESFMIAIQTGIGTLVVINTLTTYWLQRDFDSPAEGHFPRDEILSMVKHRVIALSAVVNEPGQPVHFQIGM